MKPFAVAVLLVCTAGCDRRVATVDVWTLDEGVRAGSPHEVRGRAVQLEALRDETAAFQIAALAPPGSSVSVVAPPLRRAGDETEIELDVHVEQFVDAHARSRNDREGGSLAFTDGARPARVGIPGALPDALIPANVAAASRQRPDRARSDRPTVFWIDVHVPPSARAGTYRTTLEVVVDGAPARSVPCSLHVDAETMPYRGTSVFAFYDHEALGRFVDPDAVEQKLVQSLHAHHVDAISQIVTKDQIRRTTGALDGTWFGDAYGYRGPGRGVPPAVVALGAYGSLGAPTPEGASLVRTLASSLPRTPEDLFVYAVDEQCDSPLGPDWKKLFVAKRGILVGHTCHEDPVSQPVDLVMSPAQAYAPSRAALARDAGKRVFVYNGQLPFAGPMMLDVPLTSLTLNGWIAARYDVTRWFYWETVFWNDGNRGGHGPRDVFVDPETFHNADGDTALYDGMLFFPGRSPAFPASDFGVDEVFPSMRLKSLRRGIQDAGLVALAARIDPEATRAIVERIVPAAFDRADAQAAPPFILEPALLADARRALRRIVRGPGGAAPPADVSPSGRGALRAATVLAGSLALSWLLVALAQRRGSAPSSSPRS